MKTSALEKTLAWTILGIFHLTNFLYFFNFFDSYIFPKFAIAALSVPLTLTLIILNIRHLHFREPFLIASFGFILVILSIAITKKDDFVLFGGFGRNMGVIAYVSSWLLGIVLVITRTRFHTEWVQKGLIQFAILNITLNLFFEISNAEQSDNSIYSSFSGVYGNPNFMSLFSAISATICLSEFLRRKSLLERSISIVFLLFSFRYLYLADSKQGYLYFIVGCGIFFYGTKISGFKLARRLFLIASSMFISTMALAIVNLGPLKSIIYEDTFRSRLEFFRAAYGMSRDFMIAGVGIEKFHLFFPRYINSDYVQRFGPLSYADSAHNTFLQLFATGGIFVFLSYLAITVTVTVRIRKFLDDNNFSLETRFLIVALWVIFQVNSLISPETPTSQMWIATLSAVIISPNSSAFVKNNASNLRALRAMTTTTALIFTVVNIWIPIVTKAKASSQLKTAFSSPANRASMDEVNNKIRFLQNASKLDSQNSEFYLFAAETFVNDGIYDEAKRLLFRSIDIEPEDFRVYVLLRDISEATQDYELEIMARMKLSELTPYDNENMLGLIRRLDSLGRYDEKKSIELKLRLLKVNRR